MITQKQLKKIVSYNPKTGQFRSLVTRGHGQSGVVRGQFLRGFDSYGYRRIKIKQRSYAMHRLAWLYVYGKLPPQLDHKNRNRSDNRISNLRVANHSQNIANAKKFKNNTTGFKGVTEARVGHFRARTRHNYKELHIGYFDTAQAAHCAYLAKVKEIHGEFANAG